MVVLVQSQHTHSLRGDANMAKQLSFPPDVEDFIHELIFKALLRKAQAENKLASPSGTEKQDTKGVERGLTT